MSKKKSSELSFYFSFRFLFGVIGFFGFAFQYTQKIDMGLGIVCMVNHTAIMEHQTSNQTKNTTDEIKSTQVCSNIINPGSHKKSKGTFVWKKDVQGLILSAYFYGYISFQIIAGILAAKFGSKIMLSIGMFFGSLMTLLVPVTANWNYKALIVCRFMTGISNAFFMPGMSSFWVHWAPPNERSRLIGMSHAGGMIGNIFALMIGGLLCSSLAGWPTIFYLFGSLGIAWTCLMLLMFTDSPSSQRCISEQEKNYILTETELSSHPKRLEIPWLKIMTSKPCYAIFVSHFCNNWGIYLFMTQIPSYMKEVLKFDIKSNGFVTSIPLIACFVFINVSSLIADRLLHSKVLSRTQVRKIFNGLGLSVPVVGIFGLSFVTCANPYLGVALLTLGYSFIGCSMGAGYYVNINDLAGPYSSVVFGISNTFGSIPGLICPHLTAVITKHQTQAEWRIVLIICACIYLFGFIFYTIFGNGEQEEWAKIKTQVKDFENENKIFK